MMSDEDKPFECVGERRESAVALRMLSGMDAWRDAAVVAALSATAASLVTDDDVIELLTPQIDLAYGDAAVANAVDVLLSGAR